MAGRPRGAWADKAWRDALRVVALLPEDDKRAGKTNLEACAIALVRAGKSGDVSALKEIGDRLDGKTTLPVEHAGPGGSSIQHVHRIELVDLS